MSRTRRTARVTIEDLFAEMNERQRAEVMESLRTIDRIRRKAEQKNGEHPERRTEQVDLSDLPSRKPEVITNG